MWLCATGVTVVLLILAAVPSVRTAQQAAEDTVTIGGDGTAVTGLRAATQFIEWKDRLVIYQVAVAGDEGAPVPPGLSRLPAAGETAISPALAEQAGKDPLLRSLIPGTVVATIGEEGLISPSDLRLYVGVEPEVLASQGRQPVYDFGAPREFILTNPILPALAALTALLFVFVPVAVIMMSALGQVSTRRGAQLRALHLLGASRRFSRLAVSVDAITAAAAGAVAGLVAVLVLRSFATGVPFLKVRWWPNSVSWPWPYLVLAVLVPPVLAVVSAATSRPTEDRPRRRWTGRFRFWPFAVGIVLLVVTFGQRVDGSLGTTVAVAAAIALLALGAPAAAQALAGSTARRLIDARSTAVHLAAARVVRGPVPARRAMTVITAVVVLGAAVAPLVAQAAPTDRGAAVANERLDRVVVRLEQLPPGTDLSFLTAIDGVLGATAGVTDDEGTVNYAMPCEMLRRFEGPVRDCRDGLTVPFGDLSGYAIASLNGIGSETVTVGSPTMQVIGEGPDTGYAIAIGADADTYWAVKAKVNAGVPSAYASANLGGLIGGLTQSFSQVQDWLRLGLLGLLAAAGIALLLGLSEDARARRTFTAGLIALGTPPSALRRAHRTELAIRLGATATVAAVAAIVIATIAATWSNSDPLPASWIATLLLGLATLTATAVIVFPQLTRTSGDLNDIRKD